MILYFSGTGNSAYAAKRIGAQLNDETLNLFEKIRTSDFSELRSSRPWIIAAPTYAWRIPRIVQKWLEHTTLSGSRDIYFVMTCGGSMGNAGKYLENLCSKKGMNYRGCIGITMPENYIALFSTPTKEKALQLIGQAENVIDQAAACIKKDTPFPQPALTFIDKINSSIVNILFYPVFVHAKKFYATANCISCGKCAGVCPLQNIHLENGRPVWKNHCTHCMACICRCPKEAIEYGKHSQNLPRYICPKE